MTTVLRCDRCGAALVGLSAPGLCPACLMALAGNQAIGDELDSVSGPDRPTAPRFARAREQPSYIGPYRILEKIGEGGMGVVYRAEQRHPIHRLVAIKVVKVGMDTHDVVARFEAERQALALMSHLNVAKVFEAGATEDGRPYFVMEFVRGEPITNYCDQHKLPIGPRLKLFVQACEAVQHAHQKAIIHRDIKPTNLLVTLEERGPVLKVIDFGVAKALSYRLTEHTLFTEQGRLIGTPEYMSPEQAEISGVDMDTRTDIYSLGVVLYELLAGALPFDSKTLRAAKFDDLRRMIREQEPPRPSQRLTALREDGTKAAAERGTDCSSLRRTLVSELEWIPLKAMSKDRADRYRSAAELADDVHNYLGGRPLIAGPQTTVYRVQKFVRKHRRAVVLVAALMVIFLALVVALAIETRLAIVAKNAEAMRTIAYQQQVQRALLAERVANQRLADKLVSIGDAEVKGGRISDARQTYQQSLDIARGLDLPTAPLLARLWCIYDRDRPTMGFFGKDQGPGGFPGPHVNCLALCPDGSTAISADADKTLRLWDLRTGLLLRTFVGHGYALTYVALSADGQRMLSSGFDHIVRIWDPKTGSTLSPFTGNTGHVYTVAIDPGGRLALSGDTDGNLWLWDIETHQELHKFEGHEGTVAVCAFSPDGHTALSGGRDGNVNLWDIRGLSLIRTYSGHRGQVNGLAFSPDGHYAVSGSFDKTVRLWDLTRDDPGRLFGQHEDWVWRVAFSPDGQTVASAGKDNRVRLWDVASGKSVRELGGQTGEALGLAFSRDGRLLIASGDDSALRVWDLVDENLIRSENDHAVCSAAVGDQGLIALGTTAGPIMLYDADSREKLGTLSGHSGAVVAVRLAADGRALLSCSADGTLRLWDLASGREFQRMRGHNGAVNDVAFIARDRAISAGTDGTLRVWDFSKVEPIRTLSRQTAPVNCLATSPDGRFVVAGDTNGLGAVWDIASGSRVWHHTGTDAIRAIAFSPDGHSVLLGDDQGTIVVGDLIGGGVSATLSAGGAVSALSFLSDSATAWSTGQDGKLKLWNVSKGQLLFAYPAHANKISAFAVSPDMFHAVSAGVDGIKRVGDFARPLTESSLEARVRQARSTLEKAPEDPAALEAFGDWFAFRGQDQWAIDFLERARRGGAEVSATTLARCYWRLHRPHEALDALRRAPKQKDASQFYLDLWQSALSRASVAATQTTQP